MGDYRELRIVVTIASEEDNLMTDESKNDIIVGTLTIDYPESKPPHQLLSKIKEKIREIEDSSVP